MCLETGFGKIKKHQSRIEKKHPRHHLLSFPRTCRRTGSMFGVWSTSTSQPTVTTATPCCSEFASRASAAPVSLFFKGFLCLFTSPRIDYSPPLTPSSLCFRHYLFVFPFVFNCFSLYSLRLTQMYVVCCAWVPPSQCCFSIKGPHSHH